MSLILEALRKSEAERQRAGAPRLHSPTLAPLPPKRSVLGPLLATLAGAALLVGAWWVARGDKPVPVTPPVVATPAPVDVEPVSPPLEAKAPEPPPVAAEPAPRVLPRTEIVEPPPPPPVVSEPDPVAERAEPPAPIDAAPDDPPPPGLGTLPAAERAALPPLKLSMHVWSADPARRFAIVDGQRVTEGALLAGGAVAQIRRDGVVIELGGRRLLLPRP